MFGLHVRLEVLRSELEVFRDFERQCAKIMAKHGGRLIGAIELDSQEPQTLVEMHVVAFPSEDEFEAYRRDQQRLSLSALQARSVASVTTTRGRIIDYDPQPA